MLWTLADSACLDYARLLLVLFILAFASHVISLLYCILIGSYIMHLTRIIFMAPNLEYFLLLKIRAYRVCRFFVWLAIINHILHLIAMIFMKFKPHGISSVLTWCEPPWYMVLNNLISSCIGSILKSQLALVNFMLFGCKSFHVCKLIS